MCCVIFLFRPHIQSEHIEFIYLSTSFHFSAATHQYTGRMLCFSKVCECTSYPDYPSKHSAIRKHFPLTNFSSVYPTFTSDNPPSIFTTHSTLRSPISSRPYLIPAAHDSHLPNTGRHSKLLLCGNTELTTPDSINFPPIELNESTPCPILYSSPLQQNTNNQSSSVATSSYFASPCH